MAVLTGCKGVLTAVAIGAAAAAPYANADEVADFYKGKQLTIQVGFGAGGGFDTTTRIVSRHLG